MLKGVHYVTDEAGRATAVQIDLAEWRELWEDFHDVMVSRTRRSEPDIPWEQIKAEMETEAA